MFKNFLKQFRRAAAVEMELSETTLKAPGIELKFIPVTRPIRIANESEMGIGKINVALEEKSEHRNRGVLCIWVGFPVNVGRCGGFESIA